MNFCDIALAIQEWTSLCKKVILANTSLQLKEKLKEFQVFSSVMLKMIPGGISGGLSMEGSSGGHFILLTGHQASWPGQCQSDFWRSLGRRLHISGQPFSHAIKKCCLTFRQSLVPVYAHCFLFWAHSVIAEWQTIKWSTKNVH